MSDAKAGPFHYRLFGLAIRSDLAIPELRDAATGSEPDVTIHLGAGPGGPNIVIDGVARYNVIGGRDIYVSPVPGVSPRNVRLYLLGSAMGLLLHQRGLLPLHANAIELDGRAIAFMGPSGSGKSTLAAWFHDRGRVVVADDVCVVGFAQDNAAFVQPGLPRLRLWKEALEASGRNPAHFARSYAGDEDWDKFDVPLDNGGARKGSVTLGGIYVLAAGDESRIERLGGVEAAEALFANTYRGHFVASAGEPKLHWEACIRLVQSIPIFRAVRRWGLERMDEDAERLLLHAREVMRQAS
jgi:hypothetical protein